MRERWWKNSLATTKVKYFEKNQIINRKLKRFWWNLDKISFKLVANFTLFMEEEKIVNLKYEFVCKYQCVLFYKLAPLDMPFFA